MPLVPPVEPVEVEQVGALTPFLFNIPDQPSFHNFVQGGIDYADAWMQGHMGGNYGLTSFPWQVTLQRRGQIYLALEALCDTLKAQKVYGSHAAFVSEDSQAYHDLIETEWGQRALEALDIWVTVEQMNRSFAKPLFLTSAALIENEWENPAIEPLAIQYAKILDRARGLVNPDIGSIRR